MSGHKPARQRHVVITKMQLTRICRNLGAFSQKGSRPGRWLHKWLPGVQQAQSILILIARPVNESTDFAFLGLGVSIEHMVQCPKVQFGLAAIYNRQRPRAHSFSGLFVFGILFLFLFC